jgi:hypothetical protein
MTNPQGVPTAAAALQPILFDAAAEDGLTAAGIAKIAAGGPQWNGGILQASNGLAAAGSWFNSCWAAMRNTPRYGVSWFRMAYGYLRVDEDGAQQADVLLAAVQAAGGFSNGDGFVGVDIESGEQPAGATAAQVEAAVLAFSSRIMAVTGRATMLYAGSYTRGLGINYPMGCELLWFPEWTATLSWSVVASMGFNMTNTLLWQYAGDGQGELAGYPLTNPSGLALDLSVMVRANLPAAAGLDWLRTHAGSQPT